MWGCIFTPPPTPSYVSMTFVFMPGSLGLNLLYSSTSFSMLSTSDWSLERSEGRVSRMWLVSVYEGGGVSKMRGRGLKGTMYEKMRPQSYVDPTSMYIGIYKHTIRVRH